jgi:hypothetical protein
MCAIHLTVLSGTGKIGQKSTLLSVQDSNTSRAPLKILTTKQRYNAALPMQK